MMCALCVPLLGALQCGVCWDSRLAACVLEILLKLCSKCWAAGEGRGRGFEGWKYLQKLEIIVMSAGQKHSAISASPAMMGLSVSRSRHILQMQCLCLLAAGSQPQPYVLIFYFRCEPQPPTPPTSPGKNKHVMTCHAVMQPGSRKNMVYLASLSGNRGQIWRNFSSTFIISCKKLEINSLHC